MNRKKPKFIAETEREGNTHILFRYCGVQSLQTFNTLCMSFIALAWGLCRRYTNSVRVYGVSDTC